MICHIAGLLWQNGQAPRRALRHYERERSATLSWDLVQRLATYMVEYAEPSGRILAVSGNGIDYIATYFASLYAHQVAVEGSLHESAVALAMSPMKRRHGRSDPPEFRRQLATADRRPGHERGETP